MVGKKLVLWDKRQFYVYIGILVLLAIPLASVGATDFFAILAGSATFDSTSLSVSINAPPVIRISGAGSFNVVEGNQTLISFVFNATDPDGVHDLNNNSARAQINATGYTPIRDNTSCTLLESSDAGSRFNCSVSVWYFDPSGNWTINATIADNEGVEAYNLTEQLEINVLTAMVMSPTALTWATLQLGQTNATANNDPIIVNNTGNDNIDPSGFQVTAYDLQGLTVNTDFIEAVNITVAAFNGTSDCVGDACFECNSTTLQNNSGIALPVANMTRGNNSNNYLNGTSGQETLFFCIKKIGDEISRQTYDTTGGSSASWQIAVS